MSTNHSPFSNPVPPLSSSAEQFLAGIPEPDAYSAVPPELKEIPHWVVWKWEEREDKPTKVPYNPLTGRKAKADDPSTWTSFNGAVEVFQNAALYDGIGFELGGTALVGIDFDNAIDKKGVVDPYVLVLLRILGDPYTEVSPSGKGLHAFVECDALPPGGRKISKGHDGVEIYHGKEGGRYFTISANRVLGDGVPHVDDISLAYLLITQNRDTKFRALWLGDTSYFDGDDSSADFALLVRLANLTQNDPAKMEKCFSASHLGQREKWINREDYRDRSIKAAIEANKTRKPVHSSPGLEFHLPAVQTDAIHDYVIAPASGQKDGWFPLGAVSLVGAPSGGSKTTLMYQLLLTQAYKAAFFGHETYGRSFLVLGIDRGKDAHLRTMERMRLSPNAIPFKHLSPAFDLDAAQQIVEKIEETTPLPEIVLVEGVDMLVTNLKDIKVVTSFVYQLQKIAAHYHIAIVGTLGSPKMKQGQGYVAKRDNLLGSVGWGRTCETIVNLQFPKNDDTSGRRQLYVLLRNGASETFTLGFNDGQLEVLPPDIDATDARASNQSKEVQWFKDQAQWAKTDPAKKWWTVMDMERDLKLRHSTALRHVADAHAKQHIVRKRVRKQGQGRAAQYRWNESPANPLWVESTQEQVDEEMAF